jgi:cysteine-rich repeat protein
MQSTRLVRAVTLWASCGLVACAIDAESVPAANGPGSLAGAAGAPGAGASSGVSGAGGSAGSTAAGAGGKAGANDGGNGGGGESGGAAGNGGEAGIGGGGESGASGTAGESGAGGSAGASGESGSAGASGESGSAGASGESGSAGEAGAGGDAGNGGSAGDAGNGGDGGSAGSAGNGGDGGSAGSAGNGGDGGSAGSAGNGGAAGEGGSAGTGGTAGTAGTAGTGGTAGAGGGGPTATCGNGIFEPGEECEDNNTTANDGCSATCTFECPANGKIVGGRCYFLTPKTFKGDAVNGKTTIDGCNAAGDHVADVLNVAELAAIYTALGSTADGTWISLAFTGNNGQRGDRARWQFPELGAAADSVWATGEPASTASSPTPCGALWEQDQGSLRLDDATCSNARAAVCEREPVCFVNGNKGFVGTNGHCYFVLPTPAAWEEARLACGPTSPLAAFETLAEQTTLGGVGVSASGDVWLGGKQSGDKQNPAVATAGWQWETSPLAPTPTIVTGSWAANEPNDSDGKENGDEDCVALEKQRGSNDDKCSNKHRPLCEFVP